MLSCQCMELNIKIYSFNDMIWWSLFMNSSFEGIHFISDTILHIFILSLSTLPTNVFQEGCPFIVCMTYAFQTPEKLCFILDLMNGGDLHYHLNQHGIFNELELQFYASEVTLGLEHMHNRSIVYRDLKVRSSLPEFEILFISNHLHLLKHSSETLKHVFSLVMID